MGPTPEEIIKKAQKALKDGKNTPSALTYAVCWLKLILWLNKSPRQSRLRTKSLQNCLFVMMPFLSFGK
jgi:hypothetical protein